MKHLELIKFVLGLFLLSLPIITVLLLFYTQFPSSYSFWIFRNDGVLIFISACGFIGAYLLNSIKKIN